MKLGAVALLVMCAAAGCLPPQGPDPSAPKQQKRVFAVLPAESDQFAEAAKATSDHLRRARLRGLDEPVIAKVPLEVVQLSIECVEPTPACYEAVGRSLSANLILFAKLEPGPKPQSVAITVSLFDVDTKTWAKQVRQVFSDEADAVYSVRDVVQEATRL